jgi:hypothetical protein
VKGRSEKDSDSIPIYRVELSYSTLGRMLGSTSEAVLSASLQANLAIESPKRKRLTRHLHERDFC